MADKVLSKSDLRKWLEAMVPEYEVVAPMPREAGPATWKDINGSRDINVESGQMLMAAKEFLLPAQETLFRYKKGEQAVQMPDIQGKPKLMIGLRLCDARAISVLDSVYLKGAFKDPYYAARREKLALMATVCDDPKWSCFCTSVGDLDEWAKCVDVLITDLGDKIYAAPQTAIGEKMVQGSFFADPTAEETQKKTQVWENLLALPKKPFAGKDIASKFEWESPIWSEMAKKCLGCGACSYLCPSCSCFDIQDEIVGDVTERFRCRDTCQFSDFTHMGHGHNPRPEKTMRVRQRVMHKFKYQTEQFGQLGCTGCGRCVENCPVNIDLRVVLERVAGESE